MRTHSKHITAAWQCPHPSTLSLPIPLPTNTKKPIPGRANTEQIALGFQSSLSRRALPLPPLCPLPGTSLGCSVYLSRSPSTGQVRGPGETPV